jgi:hypothetical protein
MSEHTSTRIELLNEENWMPWKRRIMAILRDNELEGYVDGTEAYPTVVDLTTPTTSEKTKIAAWKKGRWKGKEQN